MQKEDEALNVFFSISDHSTQANGVHASLPHTALQFHLKPCCYFHCILPFIILLFSAYALLQNYSLFSPKLKCPSRFTLELATQYTLWFELGILQTHQRYTSFPVCLEFIPNQNYIASRTSWIYAFISIIPCRYFHVIKRRTSFSRPNVFLRSGFFLLAAHKTPKCIIRHF